MKPLAATLKSDDGWDAAPCSCNVNENFLIVRHNWHNIDISQVDTIRLSQVFIWIFTCGFHKFSSEFSHVVFTSFHLACERFGMTPNPVVTEDDEDDDDKDVKNLQPSSQGCHERRRQWSLFTKCGFAVILWNTIFRFQKGSGMIWIFPQIVSLLSLLP